MQEQKDQLYYTNLIWQIQRFHRNEIEIDISLTPDFGVPLWTITVKIRGSEKLVSSGEHFWKRLKKAYEVLKEHFPTA